MRVARNLVVSALSLSAAASPAQQGGDMQAQILYAYQTEDGNSLANLTQDLTTQVKADGGDASLRYHLAHAQYRRGLLAAAGAGDPRGPEAAFSDCIDAAQAAAVPGRQGGGSPDTAVRLLFGSRGPGKLESVLLRSRADERLDAALKLAPRNPRAVFLSSHEGPAPGEARHRRTAARLRAAAARRAIVRSHPRPRASTRRAGDMPRRIWRSGGSCRRAPICWARATGSRNP